MRTRTGTTNVSSLEQGVCRAAAGSLVLVLAPDRVGTDVLLTAVRRRTADIESLEFPKLITTRRNGPADTEVYVSREVFRHIERDGGLLASWDCGGVRFGLASCVGQLLLEGKTVVIAGSKSAAAELPEWVPRMRILQLSGQLDTARAALTPQACLRRMMGNRLAQRLEARTVRPRTEVINWADVSGAVRQLTEALMRIAEETGAPSCATEFSRPAYRCGPARESNSLRILS